MRKIGPFVSVFILLVTSTAIEAMDANGMENMVKGVLAWWEKMSQRKPVSCKWDSAVTSSFRATEAKISSIRGQKGPAGYGQNNSMKYFMFRCQEPRLMDTYELSGPAGRDGNLNGGGRLTWQKTLANGGSVQGKGLANICYSIPNFLGHRVIAIVGKFVRGLLDGHAKLTLEDDEASKEVITTFKMGFQAGLTRIFDPTGNLQKVVFMTNSSQVGQSWFREGPFLFHGEASSLHMTGTLHKLIIPLQAELQLPHQNNPAATRACISGIYHEYVKLVDSVKEVISLGPFSTGIEDACLPHVTFEAGKDLMAQYHINEESAAEVFRPGISSHLPFCKDNNFKDVKAMLKDWLGPLNKASRFLDYRYISNAISHFLTLRDVPFSLPVDPRDRVKLVSDVSIDFGGAQGNHTAKLFGGDDPVKVELIEFGLDTSGQLHGPCHIYINEENLGMVPKDFATGWRYSSILATFDHGAPTGMVKLLSEMDSVTIGFVQDNALHGLLMVLGQAPLLPLPRSIAPSQIIAGLAPGLGLIGYRNSGYLHGSFWMGMAKTGFLHGTIGNRTSISGSNLSFVYSDMELALVGRFDDRVMKDARLRRVASVGCDSVGSMLVVSEFLPVTDNSCDGDISYRFDPPTNASFGGGPPGARDPYESKYVRLGQSSVPGGGQGVFSNYDLPEDHLVAFYNGYVLDESDDLRYKLRCAWNTSLPATDRRQCVKYDFNLQVSNLKVTIPPEKDNQEEFPPCLGPKLNHKFKDLEDPNVDAPDVEHPRWGYIAGIVTTRPVKAGEELFLSYNYRYQGAEGFPYDHPWYWDRYRYLKKQRRLAEETSKMDKKISKTKRPSS